MTLKEPFSPWINLSKAHRRIEDLESKVETLEEEAIVRDEMIKKKDDQLRRLGLILAMRGGIAVLFMLCLSLLAQPTLRNEATTNQWPLSAAVGTTNVGNGGIGFVWGNTNNGPLGGATDGNIQISWSRSPAYGIVSNYSDSGTMSDSVIIGAPPDMGVGPDNGQIAQGDFPLQNFHDSVAIGSHCAPMATNIVASTFIGWNAAPGTSGTGPYLYINSFFLGTASGPGAATNVVNSIFIGPSSGSAFGFGGGVTNCTVLGRNSGTGNHTLFQTNCMILGTQCQLPTGASGELSIQNLIYGVSNNLHGGGNIGIGNYTTTVGAISNKFQVEGVSQATFGFFSYATNINSAISNLGFTNDTTHGWGTNNMIVDIIAVGETVAFYNRSGAQGQTSCGTLLFTDTGIANKEYNVGINCGVTFSVGTFTSGTARAF